MKSLDTKFLKKANNIVESFKEVGNYSITFKTEALDKIRALEQELIKLDETLHDPFDWALIKLKVLHE